jgi:molybdopterin converting factor small subunit
MRRTLKAHHDSATPLTSPDAEAEKGTSRRRMLRSAILLSAVGAGIVLGLDGVVSATRSETGGGRASKASSPTSPSGTQSAPGDSLTVTVAYFGMPQSIISDKEEYFVLRSPAYFRDLLSEVAEKHPQISIMIPTMIISVNGDPGQSGALLRDGDEVDFVPATAGG